MKGLGTQSVNKDRDGDWWVSGLFYTLDVLGNHHHGNRFSSLIILPNCTERVCYNQTTHVLAHLLAELIYNVIVYTSEYIHLLVCARGYCISIGNSFTCCLIWTHENPLHLCNILV